MKKLVSLMLVLALCLFAGCTSENVSVEKEDIKEKKETTAELTKGYSDEDAEPEEDEEEPKETERIMIDESWLALIGKTSSEIADVKGAMSENLWADGPLYRFGPENVWYAFENYDFSSDNSYIPLGACNSIGVPLYMLLEDAEVCNAEALEKAVGKVLSEGFDAMYECNTYSVTYNGFRFVIYEASTTGISQESVVNIERE